MCTFSIMVILQEPEATPPPESTHQWRESRGGADGNFTAGNRLHW